MKKFFFYVFTGFVVTACGEEPGATYDTFDADQQSVKRVRDFQKKGKDNGTLPPDVCGDGIIIDLYGEECDGANLGGMTCEDFSYIGGSLACAGCNFDFSACTAASCGDGIINQAIEECDGTDLGGMTCEDFSYIGGSLACAGCNFDFSACIAAPTCGDGTINQPSEECDGTDLGGMTCQSLGFASGALACLSDCSDVDSSDCTGDGEAPTIPGDFVAIKIFDGVLYPGRVWWRIESTDNVGVAGYQIWRRDCVTGYEVLVDIPIAAWLAHPWHDDYGTALMVYHYKARAYDAAGNFSDFTEEKRVHQGTQQGSCSALSSPPDAPSGLNAFIECLGNGYATTHLSWNDNSDNEAGFDIEIYRSNLGTGSNSQLDESFSLTTNSTEYDDIGIRGARYTYYVRAFNGVGESQWDVIEFDFPISTCP